jgi:hypothetical protein
MASRKTKKPEAAPALVSTVRELKGFYHPVEAEGTFGFDRFYWLPGAGRRESILPRVLKKRRPAGADSDEDTAAKVEPLLPRDAPEIYSDVDFLVGHYQDCLPLTESTAYAQVTLKFPDAPNAHSVYEASRSWVRNHFVDSSTVGVPAILVLHAPYLAGSESPVHAHALVLGMRLSRFGWSRAPDFSSDAAQQEALASWTAFRDRWWKEVSFT